MSLSVPFLLLFFSSSLPLTTLAAAPIFGLYHGAAPKAPADFPAYEQWIGRPIIYGTDFMCTDNWSCLEGGGWQLGPWSQWVLADPARYFVISIPMVPNGAEAEIVAGAQGKHNSTWQALGKNLLSYNLTRTVLRIGWEMNGNWYPWKASTNPTAWVQYFQVIVEILRGYYSGWKVIWNPNAGYSETDATTIWPGNSYVDYVGIDTYDADWNTAIPSYNLGLPQRGTWNINASYNVNDLVDWQGAYYKALKTSKGVQPPAPNSSDANWGLAINPTELSNDRKSSWNDYYSGGYGLVFWTTFAKNHSKPVVLCEWAVWLQLHGGGDNAYYIEQMYNYIYNTSNNVFYYSYFENYEEDGDHHLAPDNTTLPTLPTAAAKFQQLFGGK